MRKSIVFLCLTCLLAGGFITAVAAAPPPTDLCGVCHGDFSGASERGTLDIYVDENGDSQWVERVPLENTTATRFRDNHSLRDATIRDAWSYHATADGDENFQATVSGETLVVNYSVADVAQSNAGDVWLVDYFFADSFTTRYTIGGKRVTLHPPEGYTVTRGMTDRQEGAGSITWYPADAGSTDRSFSKGTVVTYGPDTDIGTSLFSYVAIGTAIGPAVVVNGVLAGIIPTLVLAGGALASIHLRSDTRFVGGLHGKLAGVDSDRCSKALTILGAVVGGPAIVLVVLSGSQTLGTLAFGGAVYALLGRWAGALTDRGFRWLIGGVIGVSYLGGLLAWLFTGISPFYSIGFILAGTAFLPFGYASERGHRTAPILGIIIVCPIIALASTITLYQMTTIYVWVGLILLPATMGLAVAGYLLSVLGQSLATENTESSEE